MKRPNISDWMLKLKAVVKAVRRIKLPTRLNFKLPMKSLQTRLMLLTVLTLLIPCVVLGLTAYNSAKKQLQVKLEETAQSSVNQLNQTVDQMVQSEIPSVDDLAGLITSQQMDAKDPQLVKLIRDFKKHHPQIEDLVLGNDNGIWLNAATEKDPQQGVDPRTADWYKLAQENPGKTAISDPYITDSGSLVVSLSTLLPDRNGVVGVLINLSKLKFLFNTVKIGSEGYAYVLDRNNKIVTHPTLNAGEQLTGEQYDTIHNKQSGNVIYTQPSDGTVHHVFYTTNNATGWKIATVLKDSELNQSSFPILLTTAIVLLVSLCVAVVILYIVVRRITRPIEQLTASAKRVSAGHLDEQVVTNRTDEIGDMAANYNAMVESLRSMVLNLSETSGHLAASSQQLTASTDANAKAVEHVTELVQDSAKGAETQAYTTAESARAMEEMSAGILKIAESAGTIVETSAKTAEDVETGSSKVMQVSKQMETILQSVEETSGIIKKLNELSSTVSGMNTYIADIAGQTNLLSLNASIEAARAGEHGRGFAVVASEFKKLADQSKQTADLIRGVLGQMTALITSATTVMENKVVADVEKGITVTAEAHVAFTNIQGSAKLIFEQIHDVSAITEQMSASAEEVSASVQEMAYIARNTTTSFQMVTAASEKQLASMGEITSSAAGLSNMAKSLKRVVESFKL